MNIAFTICSNNYLAHAKTLGDSFLQYHNDFIFIVGLVDEFSDKIDYSTFENFKFIPVEKLQIEQFDELKDLYNITELNTAVKPTYFKHLFEQYKASKVIYIDPDIWIHGRFAEVIDALDSKNIVLTPHICSPINEDGLIPSDYGLMRTGVFNLGFIALSNYEILKPFLSWWHERVIKYGFGNYNENMFYDQLWMNMVPAFYENYYVLRHPGYNVANWNLHERNLKNVGSDQYMVNDQFELKFFHFSSFKYDKPDVLCHYQNRYNFNNRPELKPLFDNYRALLKNNNIDVIKHLPVVYYPLLYSPTRKSIVQKIIGRIGRAIKVLVKGHI
jgi:hypothetical protein